jgi:predicted secreted protein
MGVVGGIIAYLIIWWTVLFAILPMRVKSVWESPEEQTKGVDRGAPVNPEIWFKVKRTTWVAAIFWVVVYAVVASGVFEPDV